VVIAISIWACGSVEFERGVDADPLLASEWSFFEFRQATPHCIRSRESTAIRASSES
jgi:hypothetical protein